MARGSSHAHGAPTTRAGVAWYWWRVLESDTHSFVVKVWLEERAPRGGKATWRGHVTHVPSGERRYVTDADEIADFVVSYLQRLGVRVGLAWRIRRLVGRCRRPRRAQR